MRVQRLTQAARQDDGAVAVFVAFLLIIFMVLAAFALDIGNAYAQARQLSVAADAAALAAAAKVGEAMPTNTPCTPAALTSIGAQSIAQSTATSVNNANAKSGTSAAPTVTVSCVKMNAADAAPNAIEVTVNNSRQISTNLAGVIGIDHISPNSFATARYMRTLAVGGLRPWAACNDTVLLAKQNPTTTYWTGIDSMPNPSGGGPCNGYAAGNWGAIDFNGGSNGAPDLINWTLNGYPNPVTIPDPTMPADPGVTNSVADALHSLVGNVVAFPAVTNYSGGGGNNASFNAVGIATVKVCAIQWQNSFWTSDLNSTDSGCWVTPSPPTSQTTTATATSKVGVAMQKNKDSTLTTTTPIFPNVPVPPNVSVSVTITQATGPNPKTFTSAVTTYNSTSQVVLTDQPSFDVAVNDNVSIVTTTVTGTGGFGPYVYQGNKWNVLNHIQFRYVDYTFSNYTGSNPTPCDPNSNNLCAGVTLLWK
jgi:Flp pilus assembly protein TadG